MAPLDSTTLEQLGSTREIDARTPRRDGSMSSRPIWVVVDDGDAYVRSYRGETGAWYRRARTDGRMMIAVDGNETEVATEPVDDEEINRRVSDAFRAKYGASSSATQTMVNPEVSRTTLRLTAP
ncbi:MAG TPA: DUF2255 family protein [Solirubrobacteraceae bacterium]|nr:DUF2255 family protein [Solirubrobacteraceae bacterium]